jgi:hypothetical protein
MGARGSNPRAGTSGLQAPTPMELMTGSNARPEWGPHPLLEGRGFAEGADGEGPNLAGAVGRPSRSPGKRVVAAPGDQTKEHEQ